MFFPPQSLLSSYTYIELPKCIYHCIINVTFSSSISVYIYCVSPHTRWPSSGMTMRGLPTILCAWPEISLPPSSATESPTLTRTASSTGLAPTPGDQPPFLPLIASLSPWLYRVSYIPSLSSLFPRPFLCGMFSFFLFRCVNFWS